VDCSGRFQSNKEAWRQKQRGRRCQWNVPFQWGYKHFEPSRIIPTWQTHHMGQQTTLPFIGKFGLVFYFECMDREIPKHFSES
jgi:hypothetical protein